MDRRKLCRVLVSAAVACALALLPRAESSASPPSRFVKCTIVNGETQQCAGPANGEVIFADVRVRSGDDLPSLHRCQAKAGLIRKCRAEPLDGATVTLRPADGKYHRCRVAAGVIVECDPTLYTGAANIVSCDAANCARPFDGAAADHVPPPPTRMPYLDIKLPASAHDYQAFESGLQHTMLQIRFAFSTRDLVSFAARLPCRLGPAETGPPEHALVGTNDRARFPIRLRNCSPRAGWRRLPDPEPDPLRLCVLPVIPVLPVLCGSSGTDPESRSLI